MSGRPLRTDRPVQVKAMRAVAGYIGQVIGHAGEILWECPPRSDGRDDPEGGPHHAPHASRPAAHQCAMDELAYGRTKGRYL